MESLKQHTEHFHAFNDGDNRIIRREILTDIQRNRLYKTIND